MNPPKTVQERVLDHVRYQNTLGVVWTRQDLVTALGVSDDCVYRALSVLREQRLVRAEPGRCGRVWLAERGAEGFVKLASVPAPDTQDNPKLFGAVLHERRSSAGMSLRSLAESLGLSHTFILAVERGQKPPLSPRYWSKLSQIFPELTRARLTTLSDLSNGVTVYCPTENVELRDLVVLFAQKVVRGKLTPKHVQRIRDVLRDTEGPSEATTPPLGSG